MKGCAALLLLATFFANSVASKSYEGWQAYQTKPLDKLALMGIQRNVLSNSKFQIWRQPQLNRPAEILVCPKNRAQLLKILKKIGIKAHLYINDVEKVLRKERQAIDNIKKREKYGLVYNVTFDRYMNFDEITEYVNEVASKFPSIASVETIGTSFEGRPQTVLKLSSGNSTSKIGVFVDAAIHAAEWLGPAVALNAIHQLTENQAANQDYLDMADWYILPVANPDGYVFSWEQDRLWRKTRRPNEGSSCFGADPNRNFNIHWGEGGERDACVWNCPGPNVYSEIESKNMADFLIEKGLTGVIDLYMTLHTDGQVLLHPYGYSTDIPPNSGDIISSGDLAVKALESVRGTKYTVGSIANIMYLAYGNSQDFAYDEAEIPFAYTWELPGGGENGHDPPPSEIKPVVTETWEGFKAMVRNVYNIRKKI
ncbi:carboxypeptidase B-like isoform X2 [Neocloeon triangulifer]|uniref:carboxypeptidase B-like isoform X2 n=1 Tax=Neocloeon triangulifer TaxID=2078957 RepID=UPI00286F8F87|nr:carboxypeptidase B-like isoform X2 [Neocloeon triangulifer]